MGNQINICLVDDHKLFRKGLSELIRLLDTKFHVTAEFDNGKQFINGLEFMPHAPDLLILDIDMPVMDGFETLAALNSLNREIPTLIITMVDDEQTLIRMMRLGVRGYLSKEIEPDELKTAIYSIATVGYHFTEALTGRLIAHLKNGPTEKIVLSERELEFIQLCCTEMTYQEIAEAMHLSPKTIDGYRAKLFERFDLKSRVGLVLLAIKKGWITL
jgi:two-component system, NarL family, invasion response regulator UvrY